MIREAIGILAAGKPLAAEETRQVAREILEGEATPAQIGAFATALRFRGETAEHIQAFAEVMREKAARIAPPPGVVLDTCGTGGDASGTFNISTVAALVAAGAGVAVAKHGNRSATSQCGSADALEALGVKIDLDPAKAERCLREIGICFMFAPKHHAAMRHAAGPRKEIGIRTIFNLLGPLSNPAGATHQLIGVFDGALAETYARVLANLGSKRALVVHGADGLDEFTTTGPTRVVELDGGQVRAYSCEPEDFGFAKADAESLRGGAPAENREIILAILQGKGDKAKTEIALLNSGAALYAAEKALSIAEGIALARATIASGAAMKKLEELREWSNRG